MSEQTDLERVLTFKKRRLQKLEERQALSGIETPPVVLLEIEDLRKETKSFEDKLKNIGAKDAASILQSLPLVEIEPHVLTISGKKWTKQTIKFTNLLADVYHHVVIKCQVDWPVNLSQSKFVLDDLVQSQSQPVELDVRVDDEPDKIHTLSLRLTIDNHPPQTDTLRILTETEKVLAHSDHLEEPLVTTKPGEESPKVQRPSLKNIRALLTGGFNDNELRRFCYDEPDFRPVYEQLAEGMGKDRIIDKIVEHAQRKELLEVLLTWAKESNPAKYEQHQPYYMS